MNIQVIKSIDGKTKQWVALTGGEIFRNRGMIAEVGYTSDALVPPVAKKGGEVLPGEEIALNGRSVWVLADSLFSYEFIIVE